MKTARFKIKAAVCFLLIACTLLVGFPSNIVTPQEVDPVRIAELRASIADLLGALKNPSESLEIYFFELNPTDGNPSNGDYHATGDSCIMRIGDVEILVDAGAAQYSAPLIIQKMESLISSDNKWDYIIVTHSDSDHIAAFTGDKGVFSKFKQTEADLKDDTKWTLGTLIDFDITKDETVDIEGKETLFTKNPIVNGENDGEDYSENLYDKYAKARDAVISTSKKADKEKGNYFTASQCCWADRGLSAAPKEGAKSEFALGNGATLHILYNYYYDHAYSKSEFTAADKNLLSVCFLIELKGADGKRQTFLFTGDLPEFDSSSKQSSAENTESEDYSRKTNGEKKLIEHERNKKLLEGGVTFYKAAHHGSRTSSSQAFIDFIRPQYVVVPAVAGSRQHAKKNENVFPAETVMNRFFKYTDHIYITEKAENVDAVNDKNEPVVKTVDAKPYYDEGQTILRFVADGSTVKVNTLGALDEKSNGDEEGVTPPLIQYTEWFQKNRTATLSAYMFSPPKDIAGISSCTLLKYGHTEILIDCGIMGEDGIATNSMCFVDQIAQYCVDGVLEYVIVSGPNTNSLTQMIGTYNNNKEPVGDGVMDRFEIGTLIDGGDDIPVDKPKGGWRERYIKRRREMRKNKRIKTYYKASDAALNLPLKVDGNDQFTLSVFNRYPPVVWKDANNYSLCVLIEFFGEKLLFAGNLTNDENAGQNLIEGNEDRLSNVTLYVAGGAWYNSSDEGEKDLNALFSTLAPEYAVITGTAGYSMSGKDVPTFTGCQILQKYMRYSEAEDEVKRAYLMSAIDGKSGCGNMTFSILVREQKVHRTSMKGSNGTTLLKLTDWYKNKGK